MDDLHEIRTAIERHGREGATETPVPGLSLYVANEPTARVPVVYQPLLCLISSGAKDTLLGDRLLRYDAGKYLTVSVDLPVSGQVIAAPYLALSLALDPSKIASLMLEAPDAVRTDLPYAGLQVNTADAEMLGAMNRMVRLLDRPGDVAVLWPLIEREILWRLLQGPSGPMVRQIGVSESRVSQVNRAIQWLRLHLAEPVRIDQLARIAGMSAATFHRHFKAVTAMSPLQYQKQLRLQEARSRLLAEPGDVAGVGFSVGYDSPSQFSREYARLFGEPPGRDVARLRSRGVTEWAVA